jgi:adenylate cyclase
VTRRLRLWSGLILFVFVGTHMVNHALGMVSLGAVEAGRAVFLAFWRSPAGTALLYPSLVLHVGLVLWALYQRRYLRLPWAEVVRLALGLAMPILLIPHIFGTRVLADAFGVDDSYAYVVTGMAVLHPSSAVVQSVLLVIAWMHGCMGVHWWLSLKRWYPRWLPLLRALALLLPVFALLGFAETGRNLTALAADPAWLQLEVDKVAENAELLVQEWARLAIILLVGMVALTFGGRQIRALWARRKGVVQLVYPNGRRVEITPGTSVLEASRAAGIPHASLCGGRGRCSTCRSRIGRGWNLLDRPGTDEQRVLSRVGAPPNVRLACQVRPSSNLEIFPLLSPVGVTPADGFLRPPYTQGIEQEIAILFADMRSFTKFSEHRLPFDVVFVLNQYFNAMGGAVERAGGHLDKFIGDGVMALFGLKGDPAQGCLEALIGALEMSRALVRLNQDLANDLNEPIRIGIGIHMGPVVVGEMGYGRATTLTAIGDAVNTASRLESMNKEYGSQLIVSEEVASAAGLNLAFFESHEIEVRGRSAPMAVHVIPSALDLEKILAVGSRF